MDPRRLLPVLAFVAVISVVACTAAVLVSRDRPAGADEARTSADPTPSSPDAEARRVLAAWDERRAAAWAAGDVAALRRLYAPGSSARRADVRMLRSYAGRGLRVEGLATQVLGLTVSAHSDSRLVLVVTDRLAGGVAVPLRGAAGASAVPLPVDRASTRVVELRRVDGDWLVASVRDVRS